MLELWQECNLSIYYLHSNFSIPFLSWPLQGQHFCSDLTHQKLRLKAGTELSKIDWAKPVSFEKFSWSFNLKWLWSLKTKPNITISNQTKLLGIVIESLQNKFKMLQKQYYNYIRWGGGEMGVVVRTDIRQTSVHMNLHTGTWTEVGNTLCKLYPWMWNWPVILLM